VIRSSQQGESHGGVYLVNLASNDVEQVIDWNDPSIDWEGRGWDRGLRGIDFDSGYVYLAASDEVFIYDQKFKLIGSLKNQYLKHCHEITINNGKLYLTSTGYDSILEVDLQSGKFIRGLHIEISADSNPKVVIYNPEIEQHVYPSMSCHINNVFIENNDIYFSGTKLNKLFIFDGLSVSVYAELPFTSHNSRPYKGGVLFNDTARNQVMLSTKSNEVVECFKVPVYKTDELSWSHLTEDRARQSFARGLCVTASGDIIGGSSPATISVYRSGEPNSVKTVQLTNDIRNSIHGLEIWPY